MSITIVGTVVLQNSLKDKIFLKIFPVSHKQTLSRKKFLMHPQGTVHSFLMKTNCCPE